jgi:hypothetical protein
MSRKILYPIWGLGLSGCAGDCEECPGMRSDASQRLKCFGVASILAKSRLTPPIESD